MNLYDYDIPEEKHEILTELLSHKNVTINRIVSNSLENGEWYDQSDDEWLILLEGEAVIAFESSEKQLQEGDTLFIAAHQRHRVKNTSEKALWLTVHIA